MVTLTAKLNIKTLLDHIDLARYNDFDCLIIIRDTKTVMNNVPPESLIRTWVWMMSENNDPELMNKGRKNLISAFGSLQKAIEYIEQQVDSGNEH